MIFRIDIQGLRGIAVLFVLFYHLYPKIFSGGFIGVDIFLVISGFLVSYSIERRINEERYRFYVKFLAARIRRLFPASYVIILSVTAHTFKYDYVYFSIFEKDSIACLLIVANYRFYLGKVDYFSAGLKESPLLHYWSLSLEEQYYIIAPIIIWLGYNNILILYISMSLLSLFICIYFGFIDKSRGYFSLSSRAWEFLLGALNRYLSQIDETKKSMLYNSNIGVIFMTFVAIYYNNKMSYPSYYAILPVLLSLYTINSYSQYTLNSNRSICSIGSISYSIYLIHFPLKSIIYTSMTRYYFNLAIAAILLYNFVEIPFYKGSLIYSNRMTYILVFILLSFAIIIIVDLDKKAKNRLKNIKHYSSKELITDFAKKARNFCCLNENAKVYKSSIFFIGDSHIQQYILALFNSEYKYKYQLLYIYIKTIKYNDMSIKNYMSNIILKYRFNLCMLGNYVNSVRIYSDIYEMSLRILPMCSEVLISNDNPYHLVDPNSCIKENNNECYGEINKTCIMPKSFSKPNNKYIKVVTFWDKNIIKHNKCLYNYNYYPIYADSNHFSIFQLKLLARRIIIIISPYVESDKDFNYNNNCPYYHMPNSYYIFNNLKNQKCYI